MFSQNNIINSNTQIHTPTSPDKNDCFFSCINSYYSLCFFSSIPSQTLHVHPQ